MTIRLQLASALQQAGGDFGYRLCDIDVVCDLDMAVLAPFRVPDIVTSVGSPIEPGALLCCDSTSRCETTGFTGGRERPVVLRMGPSGASLEIGGAGRWSLSPDASNIALEQVEPGVVPAMVEECTLGAPLIIALALRGHWFLHASAVAVSGGRAVVLAGPSGAGKSTLAARLDGDRGCRRIADDMLGLMLDGGHVHTVGGFPQLKLPGTSQSPPARLRVAAIIALRPGAADEPLVTHRVMGASKVITLAAHSVAARLFPDRLLRRHLAFCHAAAADLPILDVAYPHSADALEAVSTLVVEAGRAPPG